MAVTRISAPTVLCAVLLGIASPARAATVILMRAPHPSALTSEATVRLRGELTSDGFYVRVVEAPATADLRDSLEAAAALPDVEAVVAIFGDPPTDSVELWVIDHVTHKTVTRRVPADPQSTRSAEVLSIRALELLRASFLEIAIKTHNPPPSSAEPASPEPPPEVARMTQVALEVHLPKRWAIEIGGGLLGSLQGLPPSLVPVLRAEHSWRDRFIGRLTLAGLGTRARVGTSEGSATVAQEFGLIEAAIKLRPEALLQPFVSIGGGALHVSADGQASGSYRGKSGALWTAVADVGAGARLAPWRRFELALEIHAQLAARQPSIQFFGEDVARAGRPTVVGSLTLVAWL